MIESLQNEKIKNLNRLNTDNRFRKKSKFIVVEGQQENDRAIQFGYSPQEFFICEVYFQKEHPNGKVHLVTDKVYEKIAYRGTSEGIIGIYVAKDHSLENFNVPDNASIIVVEGMEKPGNLGAILRSCEAFGIDALIITESKVDFYNPNVIRSSVGCLFGMQLFESTNEELYAFLKENNVEIKTTFMSDDAKLLPQVDLKSKTALFFGTEHSGLTDYWKDKGKNCLIPMSGTIDSLNLSNAVAISCYEFLRQKMA